MNSNENNLYDFYRLIGAGHYAILSADRNFFAIAGNNGSWPQMIFDIQPDKSAMVNLDKVFSDAAGIMEVRLAVCNKELIQNSNQELLRTNKIFPVGSWQLMEISSKDDLKLKAQADYEIKNLVEPAEIDDYTALVNGSLMRNQVVKEELFHELVHSGRVEIYGLFVGHELASGLLIYTGLNKVTGLYFIATKKDYRGKGLAAQIIGNVVQSFFEKGADKVVLQALPKAVNLYTRIGFSLHGELVIFWKK